MKIDRERLKHEIKMYAKAAAYVAAFLTLVFGGAWMAMTFAVSNPVCFKLGFFAVVFAVFVYYMRHRLDD